MITPADTPRLHPFSRMGLMLTMLVLTLGTAVLHPASARAGTYDVYSCMQPDGAPAPIEDWTPSSNNADIVTEDSCAQAGYLEASFVGGVVPYGAEALWSFLPPAGIVIHEATLHADFSNLGESDTASATGFESLSAPYQSSLPFDSCVLSAGCFASAPYRGPDLPPENEIKVPPEDLVPGPSGLPAGIYMATGCSTAQPGKGGQCEGDPGRTITFAGLTSATITLEADSPPQATAIGGTLTTATDLEGTQTLAIDASDAGPGIYQAILEVDGMQAQSAVIDSNGGHCQTVGQSIDGRPAFLYVQPCKLEINNQYLSFDLSKIPEGPHKLTVLVTDAAGDATTAFERDVVIGRGACNGTCDGAAQLTASDTALLKPIKEPYTKSALTLSGVLHEPSGAYVSGAQVELLQQASYTGAPLVPIATATTGPTGAWTFNVPRGPSRLLRVAWRCRALDAGYAAQLEYHELIYADIALKAPRHVRVGELFGFRGKLAGGYIPPEGSYLQIKIFYDGKWRTIETVRTNRNGTFSYPYAFARGTAGHTYRFLATIHYGSTYPFLANRSDEVRVRVR
jgi:hypothetical protein